MSRNGSGVAVLEELDASAVVGYFAAAAAAGGMLGWAALFAPGVPVVAIVRALLRKGR